MWNERYAQPGFAYGTEPNEFLAANAARHLAPGARVLCLAEGEGRNAVYLARQGFQVTGVDSSAVGLEKAQRLAAEQHVRIETVVADLASYDLGRACWGGVVSIFCHLPSALRARVHRAVVEALAPNGVLLLEAYTPEQLQYKTGGPPQLDLLMSLPVLRAELAGLELVHAQECVREVHEGALHNGKAAVVQLIARKPA